MIDLNHAVVLVTGGARGIGYAIAELALRCGARVAICDLGTKEVMAAASRLGPDVLGIAADVASEAAGEAAVAKVVERFGEINVLVNNAGVFEDIRGTLKQDLATWRRIVDINLQGTYLMARAAARAMTRDNPANAIVNFASINGLTGFRASNAYGVSKAAVAMLTKTLATDLAPRGIRVNAVAPGFVHTPMTRAIFDDGTIDRDIFLQRIPLGRFGEPAEVARAVVFLASTWSSYIVGTVLPIDGGWCAFGGPGSVAGS